MDTAEKKKLALILVDIQNDFLETGALPVPEASQILPTVLDLVNDFKDHLIIATMDWHPPDHTSFALNHPGKRPFDTIKLEYDGTVTDQVLWPSHCVQNSAGAQLALPRVESIAYVIKKGTNKHVDSYSAFADNHYHEITDLAKILHQHLIETVVIVGLAADYCVKFTCLDALKFGFKTVLVKQGTRAVQSDQLEPTFDYLRSKGVLVVDYPFVKDHLL